MFYSDSNDMETISIGFFSKLFTSSYITNMVEVISVVETKVTEEMNDRLFRPENAQDMT